MDGRELGADDIDAGSFRWLLKPERVFPQLHLRGIQLRGGLLATKARRRRGRDIPAEDAVCRGGCGAPETLHHVLQRCGVTHDARCARHNRIMRLLHKKLREKGMNISVEPIIPTTHSFIKPDILVHSKDKIKVIDITVVAGGRLEESWGLKVTKYGNSEMEKAITVWNNLPSAVEHLRAGG